MLRYKFDLLVGEVCFTSIRLLSIQPSDVADEATALQADPKQEMSTAGLRLGQSSWDESFSHRKMPPSPIKFLKKYDSSENPSGWLLLTLSFYQLTFFF